MYGGSVKVGSFLHKNIWCEAVTERADMFAFKFGLCCVWLHEFVKCVKCGMVPS